MNVSTTTVHMIKSLCGNLKMAFDLARVHFLEAQVTIQDFHKLQKKLEEYEANEENTVDLPGLRVLVEGVKDNVANLRSKLIRNWTIAEEGFKVLKERLQSAENMLNHLSTKKRKYEESYRAYKRLRTERKTYYPETNRSISNRSKRLDFYGHASEVTEQSIRCISVEKAALLDACEKMEDFLGETSSFVDKLNQNKCTISTEAAQLSNWCSRVYGFALEDRHIQMHSIDDANLAFEFKNNNISFNNSLRLVLLVTFISHRYLGHPYSIIYAKVNLASLNIHTALECAIERNDLQHLLDQVCDLWNRKFPLLNEVAALREKYPIDWDEDEGRFCILFGDAVKVSCTLTIPDGYPFNDKDKSIRLIDSDDKNKLPLHPYCSNASLTTWVDYLASLFHTS